MKEVRITVDFVAEVPNKQKASNLYLSLDIKKIKILSANQISGHTGFQHSQVKGKIVDYMTH